METPIIPVPDSLQVHWLWFQILLIFTFILHILFVNLILGGSLLALSDSFRGKKSKVFSGNIPVLVALTINLGVPPLLFVQVLYGHLFYSSSILMAVFWILVIPVLILAYYGTYIYVKKQDKAPLWSKFSLILSALFMLYIAFMFVNNITMAQVPADWKAYFANDGGTLLHWSEPTLLPRYLHFIVASIAIAAIGRAMFYKFSKKVSPEEKEAAIKRNLRIVGWVTGIQIALGLWFWFAMPQHVFNLFIGGAIVPTVFMMIAWIGALAIIWFSFKGNLIMTLIFGLLQVFLMVMVRHFTRNAYLDGIFHPSELPASTQVSPLIAFLLVFIIGLAFLYYMIRLSVKPKTNES